MKMLRIEKENFVLKSFVLALCFLPILLQGCYTPSPLYGTWVDSTSVNSLVISQSGDFVAKITDDSGVTTSYQGTYEVLDNVLVFNVTEPSSYTVPTEWDVRGSILYCTWTTESEETSVLTMYHVSR